MVINTNISATSSATLLKQSSAMLSQSLQRLSSGSKIISPADDSAGLAVSMKLTSQMARVSGAQNNLSDAISFSQTQDGYLSQVNSALSRMSELTVLSQDVTKVTSDRALYNQEYTALATYINNVATKDFNGVSLFTASTLTVTTSADGANAFSMKGVDLSANATYTTATADTIDNVSNAVKAQADVIKAITQLASDRATVGTNIETMTYNNNQLSTLNNNLSAANSQIMDVDVAQESTTYAKYNILVQTGTAMLAQANSMPQSVLRLLS
jgi:flagellin